MKTADFDFHLPKGLIALRPSEKRDNSRLLVLHKNGDIEHRRFSDIAEYLNEGDMLVLNNTKVFPARIIATKPSGGKIDVLLIKDTNEDSTWEIMCRDRFNGMVMIGDGVQAEVWTEDRRQRTEDSRQRMETKKFLRFLNINPSELQNVLWQYGHMPLPPYINRMPDDADKQRYQTVYAEHHGSIAAPTAGLHFTEELLGKIKDKGVSVEALTLHVGTGTFRPIKVEYVQDHKMDSEYFEIKSSLMDKIQRTRELGGRLITVGTTATRAIEAVIGGQWSAIKSQNGSVKGFTDIFICPGYEFKVIDGLITNFHLPRSTPLMLVSALKGFKEILRAYKEAIAIGYRFFSYGDAMLIL
jgi:S-adenosylmethionine:tRNA ribosyltransferase-isomerase